jgi:hypothetical protein
MAKRKCPWVAEANKKRKGYKHSEETKAKIAASVKETWDESPDDPRRTDDEVRARMAAGASKAGKSQKGKKHSTEARRNMSEAQKQYYQTPEGQERKEELAENASRTHKGRVNSPEHNDKISAGIARAIMEDRFHPEYHTKRGHHFSPKTNDKHYYRSSYELRAYQLLDADPDVALYITEPIVLHYEFNGQPRRYIPDLYIEYTDGSWSIVEVKPLYQLSWPSVQAKIACAQDALRWDYDVWTEAELYA